MGDGRKWVLGRGNSRDKSFEPRAWLGSLRKIKEKRVKELPLASEILH